MKPLRVIFVFLVIVVVLQTFAYYFRVPETMASHFDSGGRPNDWSSRPTFFGLYLVITAILALVFVGLPMTFSRIPRSFVSLPNRDYWLAPERADETAATLGRYMTVFGIATIVLQIVIVQLVISVNLRDEPRLPAAPAYLLLTAYFVFTILWVYRLITRFKKRPA